MWFTDVSRIITFLERCFPDKTFPVWSLSQKMLLMLKPKTLCNFLDGIVSNKSLLSFSELSRQDYKHKVEHDPTVNVKRQVSWLLWTIVSAHNVR